MTRLEIRTLMLSWLDDINGTYFTPDQCNTWINLAQREVQKQLLQAGENWYMKPVETFCVTGQADYVLPVDFIYLHRLEVVLSGSGPTENRQPVQSITTNQQDLLSITLGTPTNFYIKKDRVTILPTPQLPYLMRLYYSPRVADLTDDSDSPDVPEQFMEYVAILAVYNGFIKDDRAPDNIVIKKTEYKELLMQMAKDRTQDIPRQVVMVTDYDTVGAWF